MTTPTEWRKARISGQNGGCFEFADLDDGVIGVRDSKDPDGPVLHMTRHEMACMLHGAKAGEFDDLA